MSEAAIEDAELEGCDTSFLGLDLVRDEWPLLLLVEAFETCDVVRCKEDSACVVEVVDADADTDADADADASGSIISRRELRTTRYPSATLSLPPFLV